MNNVLTAAENCVVNKKQSTRIGYSGEATYRYLPFFLFIMLLS